MKIFAILLINFAKRPQCCFFINKQFFFTEKSKQKRSLNGKKSRSHAGSKRKLR